ncbi:MAG: hypothetical protein JST90_10675 [Bacteroidetes bacterium]|nr:hypothetical protein [Bacteroidota bacterium]
MTRSLLTLLLPLSISLCQAHILHITVTASAMMTDTAAIEQYDTIIFTSEVEADLISYNTPYGTAGLHQKLGTGQTARYVPTVIGRYSFKATPAGGKAIQLTISAIPPVRPPGVMGNYPRAFTGR